jgi:hypothetical protein
MTPKGYRNLTAPADGHLEIARDTTAAIEALRKSHVRRIFVASITRARAPS